MDFLKSHFSPFQKFTCISNIMIPWYKSKIFLQGNNGGLLGAQTKFPKRPSYCYCLSHIDLGLRKCNLSSILYSFYMLAVSHDKPLGLQKKNVQWKLSLFVFPEVPYKMSVSLKEFSLNWTPEVGDLPGWFRSLKSWSVSIKWGFTVHKYNDKSVKIHFCSWKTIGTKVLFIKSSSAAISFRQKSILAMWSGFLLPFV